MTSWDVITAGEIFIDLVLAGFPTWPRPGEEVFARRMRREIGGGCALTAAGLAAQGLRTAVVAVIGGHEAHEIRARFAELGVGGSTLQLHPTEPTALTVAISRADDRTFFSYSGANRALEAYLRAAETPALLCRARHVHLACAPPPGLITSLADELHRNGCTVSLDAGWHPDWLAERATHRALREVDIFMPNAAEARQITGETEPLRTLQALQALGLRRVALKLGAEGAALLWDGAISRVGPQAVQAIDTTGAGDCFDAGLLAGLLAGESPPQALARANICGALSTRALGGIAAFPSSEEIEQRLPADDAGDTGPLADGMSDG